MRCRGLPDDNLLSGLALLSVGFLPEYASANLGLSVSRANRGETTQAAGHPLFEEVSSSASGITLQHVNVFVTNVDDGNIDLFIANSHPDEELGRSLWMFRAELVAAETD